MSSRLNVYKKPKRRKRFLTGLILLVLLALGSIGRVSLVDAAEKENGSLSQIETIKLGQGSFSGISMEYSVGYNFYGKYGRQIPIFANVENVSNTEFNGWIEATIPLVERGQVYRKEVNIGPEEEVKLSMTMPLSGGFGQVEIRLVDEIGNIILENTSSLGLGNYEKILFAGILTDNPGGLEYLDNIAIKSFTLNNETLADETPYLDMLDILIINDYDTSLLTEDQIIAVKQWVLDGGTLVFGTGENAEKVVSHLADEFAIGKSTDRDQDYINVNITDHINNSYIEELKSRIMRFEEERNLLRTQILESNETLSRYDNPMIHIEDISKAEWPSEYIGEYVEPNIVRTLANLKFIDKDNVDITVELTNQINIATNENIEEGSDKSDDISQVIYQARSLGQGNVLLYNFDLATNQADNQVFEAILIFSIIENLSDSKQMQIATEQTGSSLPYSIIDSMSYMDTENIPKVDSYIIILLVYILIIGPIAYLVLNRKDKHGQIWIIVPITAVVFTFIMYLAGSETRVDEPFLGYVEMITFNKDDLVEDDLYFSLTAPSNESYTVELGDTYENINLIGEGSEFPTYGQHQPVIPYKKYAAAINYARDETVIEVNNNPAFRPVYFEASNRYVGKNPLQGDISYTGDKIEGSITNNSDYTITDAIYIGDTFLFYLGNLYSGQTLDITDAKKFFIHDINDIYSSFVIEQLIYGDEATNKEFAWEVRSATTGDLNEKRDLLYSLIDKYLNSYPHENCIIGFVEETSKSTFLEKMSDEFEVYGTKTVLSRINVDYSKDGSLLVPSISSLINERDKNGLGLATLSTNYYPDSISEEETIVEYYLPKNEQIISMEYYYLSNQNPTSEYNVPFTGRILALNRKTGQFDHIFTANTLENEDTTLIPQDKIGDYLTDKNVITLKYEAFISQVESVMLFPNISYWKGGD